ncbi:lipase [Pseudonocardia sp.]|uniref:esterase/lipase family protein n=1 Tax=Pseudonocardia sp. TaxID=60912 RepID=UPI002627F220|nr:lipase [Pseudonocardia sp.]
MRAAVRLAMTVTVTVGAAVVIGAAGPALASDDGPPLSVPAAALDAALECTDGGAELDPVLLIPGTGLTPGPNFDWNYEPLFLAQDRAYCTVELPFAATGDIQVAAEYVVHALRAMGPGTDVVGYSQGGMIGRWALKYWPDTRDLVDDLVGLAPSNHGTLDADVLCAGGPCAPAIHQQALTAEFIDTLNTGPETVAGVDYTVAYTLFDEVVVPNAVPPASSPLRGGEGEIANIAVQQVCPGHVAEHLTLGTFDPVAAAIALDALDTDGPADRTRIDPAVCRVPFMPGVDPLTFPTDLARFGAAVGTGIATAPLVPAEPPLAAYAR